MKIVLISCAKEKKLGHHKAKDLYSSTLFKFNLTYAQSIGDKVFILSAKYGLLDLDREVDYYSETLNDKSVMEIKTWTAKIITSLESIIKPEDEIILLAGEKYRRYLTPYFINKGIKIDAPFKHLGIGRQLQKLKELTNEIR